MKQKQKMNAVFILLGLVCGILTSYLTNMIISISITLLVFFVALVSLKKLIKINQQMFFDLFVSFFLIWLVTWIFLFNL